MSHALLAGMVAFATALFADRVLAGVLQCAAAGVCPW